MDKPNTGIEEKKNQGLGENTRIEEDIKNFPSFLFSRDGPNLA
jgi:hypothetical protein